MRGAKKAPAKKAAPARKANKAARAPKPAPAPARAPVEAQGRSALPSGIGSIRELALTDVTPDDANANLGTKRGEDLLDNSLELFGGGRSVLLDKNRRLVAGNKTFQAAGAKGFRVVEVEVRDPRTIVAVRRPDVDLDTPEGRGMALADNRTGEVGLLWSRAEIERMAEAGAPVDAFFFPEEIQGMRYHEDAAAPAAPPASVTDAAPAESPATRSLAERFLVPPFSVLDARQGYWQERKRQWLALGMQSEVGRGENLLGMSPQVLEQAKRKNKGLRKGGVTGKDFAFYAKKREWEEDNGREISTEEFREKHWTPDQSYAGTSIFDPVLCELAYRWFCPPGGRVLDPFAGGSVRGIVAAKLGLSYEGVDLRAEQVEANRAQGDAILTAEERALVSWMPMDARKLASGGGNADATFDLVFSCPPYFDLEQYSDDPLDLSNAESFDDFARSLGTVVAACARRLKENRFAVFVVSEIRNPKAGGSFHGLVHATVEAFEHAGMSFYNDAVLVQPVGSLPFRVRGMFESGRKLGRTHQNVLVFFKGDTSKIRDTFPLPEFGEIQSAAAAAPAEEDEPATEDEA